MPVRDEDYFPSMAFLDIRNALGIVADLLKLGLAAQAWPPTDAETKQVVAVIQMLNALQVAPYKPFPHKLATDAKQFFPVVIKQLWAYRFGVEPPARAALLAAAHEGAALGYSYTLRGKSLRAYNTTPSHLAFDLEAVAAYVIDAGVPLQAALNVQSMWRCYDAQGTTEACTSDVLLAFQALWDARAWVEAYQFMGVPSPQWVNE